MTCEDVVLAIDQAHDSGGALPRDVRSHVETCAACASYASFLAYLPRQVEALPRELAPQRDLWNGIRHRIESERVVGIGSRRKASPSANQWWAVAAALLVGLGAGVAWMKTRPAPNATVATVATPSAIASSPSSTLSASTIPAPSTLPTTHATAGALPASYETGASEFTRATADLMSALDARRNSMTPETRAVVEKNLAVIDAALVEIRSALAKDPNNRELLRMLGATRKRKIETLQLVVKLTA